MAESEIGVSDDLYEQAVAAHRRGELAEARDFYERLLSQHPDHLRGLHMSGMLAYQSGNLTAALDSVSQAIRLGHGSADVWGHYGILLNAADRLEDASEALSQAVKLAPSDGIALYNLGLVELRLGWLEAAVSHLDQAFIALPESAAIAHGLGIALHRGGRTADALRILLAAQALDEAFPGNALLIGTIYGETGDLSTAEHWYRREIEINPASFEALNNLGAAVQDQARSAEAVTYFLRALEIAPDELNARNNLAVAFQRLGRLDDAEALYRQILKADPLFGPALRNLSDMLPPGPASVEPYGAAVEAHPANASAWVEYARALERADDLAAAAKAYTTALELDPDNADANDGFGVLLQRRKNFREAIGFHQRAVGFAPNRSDLGLRLGLAALKSGDSALALSAFETVLRRDPFDQEAICYRGLALWQAGETVEALRVFDPDFVQTALIGPSGPSGDAFRTQLVAELRTEVARKWSPAGQSIRGGTQTENDLFFQQVPQIQTIRGLIDTAVAEYFAARRVDPTRPFLAARPAKRLYRSWSVILSAGGHHVSHIHPEGCVSGVYYVATPACEKDPEGGYLEIGVPGFDLPLPRPLPIIRVKPEPGLLVLFPSYFWHGVRPFTAQTERVTVVFDVCRPPA